MSGKIIAVSGCVVDVCFDNEKLPKINDALKVNVDNYIKNAR